MRTVLILLALLYSAPAMAGYLYDFRIDIDEYDPATGYYFADVQVKEERGFMQGDNVKAIDVLFFDPASGRESYLFSGKNREEIVTFLYETGYDAAAAQITFNSASNERSVKNNVGIKKRAPKTRILVVTYNDEAKIYSFWFADKNGSTPHVVKKVDEGKDWHLDVANQKLRFVKQVGEKIKIESLDW